MKELVKIKKNTKRNRKRFKAHMRKPTQTNKIELSAQTFTGKLKAKT